MIEIVNEHKWFKLLIPSAKPLVKWYSTKRYPCVFHNLDAVWCCAKGAEMSGSLNDIQQTRMPVSLIVLTLFDAVQKERKWAVLWMIFNKPACLCLSSRIKDTGIPLGWISFSQRLTLHSGLWTDRWVSRGVSVQSTARFCSPFNTNPHLYPGLWGRGVTLTVALLYNERLSNVR